MHFRNCMRIMRKKIQWSTYSQIWISLPYVFHTICKVLRVRSTVSTKWLKKLSTFIDDEMYTRISKIDDGQKINLFLFPSCVVLSFWRANYKVIKLEYVLNQWELSKRQFAACQMHKKVKQVKLKIPTVLKS